MEKLCSIVPSPPLSRKVDQTRSTKRLQSVTAGLKRDQAIIIGSNADSNTRKH